MKCHFVPQSYLKRFANSDNKLESFDLFKVPDAERPKNRPVDTKSTKTTAQIKDWYILYGVDDLPSIQLFGEKRIEEDFQKLFENDLTNAFNNLENGIISYEEKAAIARFASFQLHRVPISRSYYRQMQKDAALLTSITPEERLQRDINIIKGFIATSISGFTLHPYLMKSKWVLLENRSRIPFITSDNPIMISNHPSNMDYLHLALKNQVIEGPELSARKSAYSFSISPKKILYINTSMPTDDNDINIFKAHWADDEKVLSFNDLIFRSCLSCIYSNKKALIEEYHSRFISNDIAADLFIDNPWGEEE